MKRIVNALLVVSCFAAARPVLAQASIDPGMSRAQVIERLGAPVVERHAGAYDYLFYHNDCEHRCGTMDLVILQGDAVVDAIFRGNAHHYTGASSSPMESGAAPTRTNTTSAPGGAQQGGGGLIIGNRSAPAKGQGGIVIHSVRKGAAATATDSTAVTPVKVDPNADTTNTKLPHQDPTRDTSNTKRPATDPNRDTSHVTHGPPAPTPVPTDSTRKP